MTSCTEITKKRKSRAEPSVQDDQVETFLCTFCNNRLRSESALMAHVCEPKRRFLKREEAPVRFALRVYQHFYKRKMGAKIPPDYEKFSRSKLYLPFVRFAQHVLRMNAISPFGFVNFLLDMDVALKDWDKSTVYETYVREMTKAELPVDALARSFLLMQSWAMDGERNWWDFFREIAPAQATLWIKSGRISPWILLTASSAEALIVRMSNEQLQIVDEAIDAAFWNAKITRHRKDVDMIREELAEAGI